MRTTRISVTLSVAAALVFTQTAFGVNQTSHARAAREQLPQGVTLAYLRVAKTGSTDLLPRICTEHSPISRRCPVAQHTPECARVVTNLHHDVTKSKLPSSTASFVTMREPCERFQSIFYHMKSRAGKMMRGFQSATDWGNALLSNQDLRDAIYTDWAPGNRPRDGAYQALWEDSNRALAWKQSDYIMGEDEKALGANATSTTTVLCLPTVASEIGGSLTIDGLREVRNRLTWQWCYYSL